MISLTGGWMCELTRLLQDIEAGNVARTHELLALVYDELRLLAAAKLARESPGHTLEATALVHEVYMRLLGKAAADSPSHTADDGADTPAAPDETRQAADRLACGWQSRGHFFAAAAESMRRILIENARRKLRQKRGGGWRRVDLDTQEMGLPAEAEELLDMNDALKRLEALDAVKADVVKLRYFAGLTIKETALALQISEPTVKRYWLFSRAWLRREMQK